jgi:hypothetical protein
MYMSSMFTGLDECQRQVYGFGLAIASTYTRVLPLLALLCLSSDRRFLCLWSSLCTHLSFGSIPTIYELSTPTDGEERHGV